MTADAGAPARHNSSAAQAGGAAAARSGRQRHPPTVGRHETSLGGGHRGADDLLPRLGSHRAVALLVLTAAWIARIPRGTLPSIPGWLWCPAVSRRPDRHLRRGQPRHRSRPDRGRARRSVQFPAHHRVVDRPSRTRRDGVVDDQCRRNRPGRRDIGAPAAAVADPRRRMGGVAGAGVAGVPDADRRVPRSLRGTQAEAQGRARSPGADGIAGGGSRSSTCSRPPSPWRCGAPTKWATPSPPRGGAGQISAAPSRPTAIDLWAFVIVAVVCGAALALELTILGTSAVTR